uniref:Protein kinase domain-containing protein n=1 Tax=Arcella intermedia TaxID=1963864 RepID=A0A6B2L3S8_9EUKA
MKQSKTTENYEEMYNFQREIRLLTTLNHPNIIPLLGVCFPLAFITELCKAGCLWDILKDVEKPLAYHIRIRIAKDIAKGLSYLHSQNPKIVHLDIKSPNVLLSSLDINDGVLAKLTDFGTSQVMTAPLTERYVDNPKWLAPEIMAKKPYNEKVDTFSFGVVCWELITRKEPFEDVVFMSVIQDKIVAGSRCEIPKGCTKKYRHIIESCWHQDPKKRPSFDKILEDLDVVLLEAEKFEKQMRIYEMKLEQEALIKKQIKNGENEMVDPPRANAEPIARKKSNWKLKPSKMSITRQAEPTGPPPPAPAKRQNTTKSSLPPIFNKIQWETNKLQTIVSNPQLLHYFTQYLNEKAIVSSNAVSVYKNLLDFENNEYTQEERETFAHHILHLLGKNDKRNTESLRGNNANQFFLKDRLKYEESLNPWVNNFIQTLESQF